MHSLAEDDLGYFNDAKTWRSGPSFHAVLVQKNQPLSMKFIDRIMLDEFVLEWNVMFDLVTQNEVKYCIISVPALINPVGAKLFQRTYEHYSLSYISIPTHHMERICGTKWAFGQFDLDQIVALHNTLIHLCQKNCADLSHATIVLMDEAWVWPTKTENLPVGILAKHQIALHAGWNIKLLLPTGYVLIPFPINESD